jgi:hypothetical protein
VDEDAQGSLGHLYPSGPLGLSGEWQGRLASTCRGSSLGLCSHRILALWDPVNRRSLIIVVVGRYPIISLEMFTGIVYVPPMESPV